MSATTSAFTLILAEDPQDGGSARDFIGADNGVLYGTTDLAPGARRRRRRQIPAPWSKARSSANIS